MNKKLLLINFIILTGLYTQISAQEKESKAYNFTTVKEVATTSVKNQYQSGTCWAYATISFLESEIIRIKSKEFDLSEMYMVRMVYPIKALKYIRLQGNSTFGPGGQAHDVIYAIKISGMLTEEVYTGLKTGDDKPNHGEMDAVLKAILDAVLKKDGGNITPVWFSAFESVLDVYLGEIPASFNYKGRKYTTLDFAEETGINPVDYIELTSFTHHPFYQPFILEIPDNWANGLYYNLPVDELIEVIDFALSNGYSITWDGDVSEKEFSHKDGVAILPLKSWKEKSAGEKETTLIIPEPEKTVSQEMRQETFENQTTTDDHLMHITGIVKDQNGTKYYKTKNSWGLDNNEYGGFLNLSESFVRLKTIAIMVHKDALPKEIAKKLQIGN